MSLRDFFKQNANAVDNIVSALDGSLNTMNKTIGVDLTKLEEHKEIHEKHLEEMEAKRKELLLLDQQLVDEINESHHELASVRMAIRGVEDMIRSIHANTLTPPVISSITEMRTVKKAAQSTASEEEVIKVGHLLKQQPSRLHRQGQTNQTVTQTIDSDADTEVSSKLNAAIESELSKLVE